MENGDNSLNSTRFYGSFIEQNDNIFITSIESITNNNNDYNHIFCL